MPPCAGCQCGLFHGIWYACSSSTVSGIAELNFVCTAARFELGVGLIFSVLSGGGASEEEASRPSGSFMNRLSHITARTFDLPNCRYGVRSNPNGMNPVLLVPSNFPLR